VSGKHPPITSRDPITGQRVEALLDELEAPAHADVKALLAYWNECRKKGGFKMGRDVPSRVIARLMRNLVVLEPLDGGDDFNFRLVGTMVNERYGREVSGMLLSELYEADAAERFLISLRKVMATDAPVFQEAHVRGAFGDVRRPEAVLLPMTAPDGVSRWVLSGVFYW
jgi:hypothetical protein